MAIKYYDKYPQRWESPSNDYPQGAFKNLSALGEQDGSYLEKDWLNDQSGFFGALLRNAEMTPNGLVDTAQKSQFYDALVAVAEKVVGEEGYRKLDNNEFEGFMQVQATDDVGTGVFLLDKEGNPRGQMTYNSGGLQFAQHTNEGDSYTYTLPQDDGEFILTSSLRSGWGDSKYHTLTQEFLSGYEVARTVYVSPTGSDDAEGLENSPFKTIQKAVNSRASTIKVKAGLYEESVTIASLNNNKVLQIIFESGAKIKGTTTYPFHIRDNSNVWLQGVEADANKSNYAVLCITNSTVLLDGCNMYGATRAVAYCSSGSRIRWGNGTVLDGQGVCRECVSIYNHSSGGVYGTARNTFKNSEIGVEVSGSSYSHTDFIDFIDMSFGINAVHQSHTTNYDNTFTNCTIGWQAKGYSTINTAREKLTNVVTRSRVLNEMLGLDETIGTYHNYQQFYPSLGSNGRTAVGYKDIRTPFGAYQLCLDGEGVDYSLSSFSGNNFILDSNLSSFILAGKTTSRLVFSTTGGFDWSFNLIGGSFVLRQNNENYLIINPSKITPAKTIDLGSTDNRFQTIYLTNQPNVSSDIRLKSEVGDIDPRYLDVVSKLNYKQYILTGNVDSRLRFGIIAQDWINACKEVGLDPLASTVLEGDDEVGYSVRYADLQILINAYILSKL